MVERHSSLILSEKKDGNKCYLKALCYFICYLCKKLNLFFTSIEVQNDGTRLLFKTIFRFLNCVLSSIDMDNET